jgi:hypothetical protein
LYALIGIGAGCEENDPGDDDQAGDTDSDHCVDPLDDCGDDYEDCYYDPDNPTPEDCIDDYCECVEDAECMAYQPDYAHDGYWSLDC